MVRAAAQSLGFLAWYRREAAVSNQTPFPNLISDGGTGGDAVSVSRPAGLPGPARIKAARAARQRSIEQRCKAAGLPYPPRELFLRAFKQPGELEVWGREKGDQFQRIGIFGLTAASGRPGPKRKEGDMQVPEGCYKVAVFNPESSFHLSLGIDYPNASDRVLSDAKAPGSDIYIHGGAVSIGCLPIGDDAIDEVFLLASDVKARGQTEIPVHIFPARMEGAAWEQTLAAYPQHAAFWKQLEPIYLAFGRTLRVPRVEVDSDGSYRLTE